MKANLPDEATSRPDGRTGYRSGTEDPFRGKTGEIGENLHVAGAPEPRLSVEDAQCAYGVLVVIDQRYAEVRDDAAVEDGRVILEDGMNSRVFDD